PVRRADDPGEQRALGGREVAERLPEVDGRRLREPVYGEPTVDAQVDRGEVAREYLLLRRVDLEENREHGFLDLPPDRPARRQERVLHELLRDRAAALLRPVRAEVREERAHDRERIDAGMD